LGAPIFRLCRKDGVREISEIKEFKEFRENTKLAKFPKLFNFPYKKKKLKLTRRYHGKFLVRSG
jgi:hypothetical protein